LSDLLWIRTQPTLKAFGRDVPVSCKVRTIANGLRDYHSIVFSENADGSRGMPYQPKEFPTGIWRVTQLLYKNADGTPLGPYEDPVFIATDAHQPIEQWSLLQYDGIEYGAALGQFLEDWGYGFHCSTSEYTLGCIRDLADHDTHLWIAAQIAPILAKSGRITFEVQDGI